MEKGKDRKMEVTRRPFQGITNIVRFNWHFYLMLVVVFILLFALKSKLPPNLQIVLNSGIIVAVILLASSLLVSFYIYDLSDLYQLKWMEKAAGKNLLTVNAGFDETTGIIRKKFPSANITICDFYDPAKHTEISIRRARKAFPSSAESIAVNTKSLPFSEAAFDNCCAILAAHEIRDKNERVQFFKEIARVTKDKVFVTEHLRDLNNFLAFNIGFFHFYSRKSWLQTFESADLAVTQEIRTTPFITTFVLEKHGDTF